MSDKNSQDIEVIQPKNSKNTQNRPQPNPNTGGGKVQRSWVWVYFKVANSEQVQCQVASKKSGGENCNKLLKVDDTGSTKSMIAHLRKIHGLLPPETEKTNQLLLPNLLKRQRVEQRPMLNVDLLKQAIAYLIAEADLPYAIVERKSFKWLLELLNPATVNMEFGRKAIATEVDLLYLAHKKQLQKLLKGMKYLSYTLDAWTSPNSKAFMAITVHGITSDWKMLDMLVGMPAVQGRHTGHNFGDLFVNTLDNMEIADALFCITADNASNNGTLASRVEFRLDGIFDANTRLLGCMAHVINLAAHDGLKVFGALSQDAEKEVTLRNMDFDTILDRPDGIDVNLQTVVSRIHGLATFVRHSPQRREGFEAVIQLVNSQGTSNPPIKEDLILKRDVRTRWNSTYIMLKRALKLRSVCSTYCASSGEVNKFSLSESEWDKVEQITRFLEPLNDVTKLLCRSKYPTLTVSIPIYISLIKSIYGVRAMYDASQLIPAADEMVKKLSKYLSLALEKPAPICAMILDPRIKLSYFEKNRSFFAKHNISKITLEDAFEMFKEEATDFDRSPSKIAAKLAASKPTSSRQTQTQKRTVKKKTKTNRISALEADIFGEASVANDLTAEINQYISEVNERHDCDILNYWAHHTKIYPLLSLMARCYLGIPATSAPSERVFSRSKTIIGSQRHSLSSSSIEHLLCVKEWYQNSDEMMDSASVEKPEPHPKSKYDSDDESDTDTEDEEQDEENENNDE
ncbi:hypothetical protein MJO29_000559 [Puccinia striiformis f. sp. tritici]|nr:hypothetical protein MJO29_000559 [Puccinia striiformis f. sp. tritici]